MPNPAMKFSKIDFSEEGGTDLNVWTLERASMNFKS